MTKARRFLETFILSPLPSPLSARQSTPGAGVQRAAKRLAEHRLKWAGIEWPAPKITRQQRRAQERAAFKAFYRN
jgi:hypothetical protein